MDLTQIITITIAAFAVIISFWQGYIAKQQLKHSINTNTDTDKLLKEIEIKVQKIEVISTDTKNVITDHVTKLIDNQNENFKKLLDSSSDAKQLDSILKFAENNEELIKNLNKEG